MEVNAVYCAVYYILNIKRAIYSCEVEILEIRTIPVHHGHELGKCGIEHSFRGQTAQQLFTSMKFKWYILRSGKENELPSHVPKAEIVSL